MLNPMTPTPAPTDLTAGIADIVDQSQFADQEEAKQAELLKEQNAVKDLWKEFDEARKFDQAARAQYARDRRYAAGTADKTWAVNTNLIGSFIDILVSFLYARDPDVSVRKAPQVQVMPEPGMPPPPNTERQMDDFAKTLQIVISKLWKRARLKFRARKQVRSTLSTGPGWIKAIMIADSPIMQETQTKIADLRDNLAKLEACRQDESTYESSSPEEQDARIQKVNELMASLQQKLEVSIRRELVVDFVPSQNVQVSLDVATLADHLDADWNSDTTYVLKSAAKEKFPRLTEEDIKTATCFYQRAVKASNQEPLTDQMDGGPATEVQAAAADQYTTGQGASSAEEQGPAFMRVVELWDKRTGHIKTMADGVRRWLKEPYQPPYPSSRFYPYFDLEFFEVDGQRHSQSLPERLAKLQDEYARSRSSFRLTRERSIPGIIVNGTNLDETEVKKLTQAVHQEIVVLKPTDPTVPIQNMFAEKPIPKVDQRMFDNTPILQDMEKLAGVQEALQSSVTSDKTATEAEIQQAGFASRTTADRDMLETLLTDLAQYTGEVSISALPLRDVQRIAGPGAFWPQGMAIDDLLTLVEIEIEAGTTGKPKAANDREAWGVILPQIKELMGLIQQARLIGNFPLAEAMIALLRETMSRMGDDTDISRFIPAMPETSALPATPGAGPAPVGAASSPGSPPLPPGAASGAAPALQNPTLQNPQLQAPV